MIQDEPTRPAEGPPPLPPQPPEPPRKAIPDSWHGAVGLGLLAFFVWVVAAQIIPAVIVLIASGAAHTQQFGTEEESTKAMVPYLPAIITLGAVFSVGLVGGLKVVGWLAPAPPGARTLGAKVGWVGALTLACVGGSFLLSMLLHAAGHDVEEQELIVDAAASGGVLFLLAAVVAAPIGEEFGFRRLVFSTVRRGAGRTTAYVLSALLFALVHGNPSAFPVYVWMALCFALAYEITGSVWGAAAVHGACNLASFLLSF